MKWWPAALISSRFLSTPRYPYPLDVAFPAAIEMFTGSALDTQTILDDINHPRKLNLQSDAHDSMDKRLAWGIEAIPSGGQVSFFWFWLRS